MTYIGQRKSDGSLWRAGRSIWGLCAAHNFATDPRVFLSDDEHKRMSQYARAIRNRMKRLGFVREYHFTETESGLYWPLRAA